jgi:very-short-patch-repair endonuclease
MLRANPAKTQRARALRRSATAAERILWRRLSNRQVGGWKFVRQFPIGPYFADFACREARYVVEIDGATHSSDSEIAADGRRTRLFAAGGYHVKRFTNAEVFDNVEGVLETIRLELEARSPAGRGSKGWSRHSCHFAGAIVTVPKAERPKRSGRYMSSTIAPGCT